jgi:hypothetical protein
MTFFPVPTLVGFFWFFFCVMCAGFAWALGLWLFGKIAR